MTEMNKTTQFTTATPETASIDARLSELERIAGEMSLAAADSNLTLKLLMAHMNKHEPQKKESSGTESEEDEPKFLTRSRIGQVTPERHELRSVNLNGSLQNSGSKFNPYTRRTPARLARMLSESESKLQQTFVKGLLAKIPIYQGTEADRNPRAIQRWMAGIDQAVSLMALDDDSACTYAISMLGDAANGWATKTINQEGDFLGLADFFARFNEEYFPAQADRKYRQLLRQFKQETNETVAQATIRFNEITYNIDGILDPKECAFTFLEGLLPAIHEHITTYLGMNGELENPSMRMVELAARRAEEIVKKTHTGKVTVKGVKPVFKSKRTIGKATVKGVKPEPKEVSSATKETTSVAKVPWSETKVKLYEEQRCFKCEEHGHQKFECPNESKSRKATVAMVSTSREPDSDIDSAWLEDRYHNSNLLVSRDRKESKISEVRVDALTNKPTYDQVPIPVKSNSLIITYDQVPIPVKSNSLIITYDQVPIPVKSNSLIIGSSKVRDETAPHISRNIPEGYQLRSRFTKAGNIRESLVSIASIQRRRASRKKVKIPALVERIQISHPDQAMIFHSINGSVTLAVLGDTGASANVTSRKMAIKTGRNIHNLDTPIPIEYANGTKGEVSEYCVMKLSINGYKVSLPCYLTEDVGDIVILGVPFFMQHQVSIDWRKRRWLIRPYQNLESRVIWTAVNNDPTWSTKRYETKSIYVKMIKQKDIKNILNGDPASQVFELKVEQTSTSIHDHRPEKEEIMGNSKVSVIDPNGTAREPSNIVKLHPLVQDIVREYADIFDAPTKLPPNREEDFRIDLLPNAKIPTSRGLRRISEAEQKVLQEMLPKLLERKQIRRSKSPYGANLLFIRKSDGTIRLCIDYRALNAITIRNMCPLPNIAEMRHHLRGATVFSKMDLRDGYYNLRISEEDIHKTAFKTRYGLFEFTVLPFGLSNAPASFSALINRVLGDLFDINVISYMDDIVIYSSNEEEHREHLKEIFKRLQEHQLFAKLSKCDFFQEEVTFCGHLISRLGIRLNEDKIAAMKVKPKIKTIKDLQSYLGMTVWFQDFIPKYAEITAPLTDLLRKNNEFRWTAEHEKAIDKLISKITNRSILRYFDPTLRTIVTTDASAVAIGGWIGQYHDGVLYPVLFCSRKLRPNEFAYHTYERELLGLIYMCEKYGHYLRGTSFECNTDHKSLEQLQTQEILSGRQARWILLLQEFDAYIKYSSGTNKLIRIADFLTRNPEVQHQCKNCQKEIKTPKINAIHNIQNRTTIEHFHKKICEEYKTDDLALVLKKRTTKQFHKQFHQNNGLWFYRTNQLYIAGKTTQLKLIENFHDTKLAGHQGTVRTLAKIRRLYYWPGINTDVANFVRTCDTCQRHSTNTQKLQSYLHPLPIPDQRFEDIGIDFAFLPTTKIGHNMVMVIVDRLTKLVMAIPCKKTDGAEEIAKLLIKHWITIGYGIPSTITSDRDPKFTSEVWRHILQDLEINQRMGTARHQQTNGQAENAIKIIKRTAKKYAEYAHDTWDEYLHMVTFAINDSESSSTGFTPFYLAYGYHPRTVPTHDHLTRKQSCLIKIIKYHLDQAKINIKKSQEDQAKHYNKRRRNDEPFQVGGLVMLQSEGIVWQTYKQRPKSAIPTFLGPYRVLAINNHETGMNLTLELPTTMKRIHPTFSATYCKRYYSETEIFKDRTPSSDKPDPEIVVDYEGKEQEFFKIDRILDHRFHYRKLQLLVSYEGYSDQENEWVPYTEGDVTWDNDNDRAVAQAYLNQHQIQSTTKIRTVRFAEQPNQIAFEVASPVNKFRILVNKWKKSLKNTPDCQLTPKRLGQNETPGFSRAVHPVEPYLVRGV